MSIKIIIFSWFLESLNKGISEESVQLIYYGELQLEYILILLLEWISNLLCRLEIYFDFILMEQIWWLSFIIFKLINIDIGLIIGVGLGPSDVWSCSTYLWVTGPKTLFVTTIYNGFSKQPSFAQSCTIVFLLRFIYYWGVTGCEVFSKCSYKVIKHQR